MSPDVVTESEISNDVNFQLRSVEYVQSLLVSMVRDKSNEDEQETVYHEIANYCLELYSKIPVFYMYWTAQQQKVGKFSLEDDEYIVFAQIRLVSQR